jgi:hypothetical protein
MTKAAPDAMIDASLDYVAGSTIMTVCSSQPTTYAEATSNIGAGGYKIADVAVAGGDFTKDDDTSGRKVTVAAKSAVPIDVDGTALHIALSKVGDTTLRYVTTCTSQALTSGGTVDFPSWKINIQDPI